MLTHSNVCANIAQMGHPGTMKVSYCPATSSNNIKSWYLYLVKYTYGMLF